MFDLSLSLNGKVQSLLKIFKQGVGKATNVCPSVRLSTAFEQVGSPPPHSP